MLEKLKEASTAELEIWMLSASVMGFGLGALFSNYIQQYALWIFLLGALVHLIAMYKIYSRE